MTEPDGIVIVSLTAAMVRQATTVHLEALANTRTALMGQPYVRAFISWFARPETCRIALAAVDARGNVVGYAIGAPLGYSRALSRHLVWTSAHAVLVRPWLAFRPEFRNGLLDRLTLLLGRSQARSAVPDLPPRTMSLVVLAVSPAARRRTIGLRLMQAVERTARALQMRSIRASIRSDNLGMHRLVERCGWRPCPAADERVYYFKLLGECSE